jgi:hypothetical protein
LTVITVSSLFWHIERTQYALYRTLEALEAPGEGANRLFR